MKLSDSEYQVMKWVIALVLPAVAGLYANLGPDWGWYNPQLVVKTITEVQIFLGVIFGISCYQYKQDQKFKDTGDC